MLWFIYNCLRLSHENKTNHRFALIISFLLDINFEMEVVLKKPGTIYKVLETVFDGFAN